MSAAARVAFWRRTALVLTVALGASVVGNVALAVLRPGRSTLTTIEQGGALSYRAELSGGKEPAAEGTEALAVTGYLRHFVEASRAVSPDKAFLREEHRRLRKLTGRRARTKLEAWVNESKPLTSTDRVAVHSVEAHWVAPWTWEVNWREDRAGSDGARRATESWRAIIVLERPKLSRRSMVENPLGLLIREFSWQRIQGSD